MPKVKSKKKTVKQEFDREKAIERLVDDSVNSAFNDQDWLERIFRYGHAGLENMTDEDLAQELKERDIEI